MHRFQDLAKFWFFSEILESGRILETTHLTEKKIKLEVALNFAEIYFSLTNIFCQTTPNGWSQNLHRVATFEESNPDQIE